MAAAPRRELDAGRSGGQTAAMRHPWLVAFAALALPAAAQQAAQQGTQQAALRHGQLRADLSAFVGRQLADKELPAVCLAMVSVDPATGEEWSWARGFGTASPRDRSEQGRVPAGPDTVHRVASISKLFTATAAMVLAERGRLDLDAPVQRYLPDFAPKNPFGGEITTRLLLGHRAGIVREGPVGHYFDAGEPDLAATVQSLNDTALVHAPGSAYKYSNPGIGVVGRVIEEVTGQPFETAVEELVLAPLGMTDSSFAARPDLVARTAHGIMWTYDGRAIPTPGFMFGYSAAANLRSTVVDLCRFARSWFPVSEQRVLSAQAQAAMWMPQDGGERGCGLGFFVGQLDGMRSVHHGGAVYGFASWLQALPEQGVAVAVVATVDFANEVSEAIGARALRGMLAARKGETLPPPVWPQPVGVAAARALAGRYRLDGEWFDLRERGGELRFDPCIGVASTQRRRGDVLVSDDRMAVGSRTLKVLPDGSVHDGVAAFARAPLAPPPPPPEELRELIGEYGWDFNTLVVYEDEGRLGVLIEWLVRDLPEREGPDRYRFPPGMYGGDPLVFERDAQGAVVAAVVGGARFPRLADPGPQGFRIRAQRMVAELRAEARRARPPAQPDGLRPADLVDLRELDPTLKFDIRYATADNFLGEAVYERASASLQRPAAEALLAAHRALAAHGYGLCIFDGYRPWSVTKVFWDATPAGLRHFVADPSRGSRHNRGCAVDLTLYELATGEVVTMPSGYDEFTARAYPDWPGGTSRQRWHRELLRRAMEDQGFTVYEHEWWHFDFRDWQEYPVLDEPLK